MDEYNADWLETKSPFLKSEKSIKLFQYSQDECRPLNYMEKNKIGKLEIKKVNGIESNIHSYFRLTELVHLNSKYHTARNFMPRSLVSKETQRNMRYY